jgi:hypothetical protein
MSERQTDADRHAPRDSGASRPIMYAHVALRRALPARSRFSNLPDLAARTSVPRLLQGKKHMRDFAP